MVPSNGDLGFIARLVKHRLTTSKRRKTMPENLFSIVLLTGGLVAIMMTSLWVISAVIKDSSIADIFWGFGFVIIVFFNELTTEGSGPRRDLICLLTALWGCRLTLYIGWRNWGKEDPRYARFRAHIEAQGKNYQIHSLIHNYWYQGLFMWVISFVLLLGMSTDTPAELGMMAYFGVGLWGLGMFFESVGDWQLARFLSNPENQGKVMDKGLWQYTRHPNYFGEACVWFGFLFIAAENPNGWTGAISVGAVLYALLGPTGTNLVERRMSKKRPDFVTYKERTSGFFPLFPRATKESR